MLPQRKPSRAWLALPAAAGLAAGPALSAGPVHAAGPAAPDKPALRAFRLSGPIVLDGVLDEADWQLAEPAAVFIQRYPAEGEPSSQPTRVKVLFDADRLIIGAELEDTDPAAIIAREMKEDADLEADDSFAVTLDTFLDRRNGYYFQTNPLGARRDALIFDEGGYNSFDWDGVWDVATHRDGHGWSVEMEIPLRTLHFHPEQNTAWGLQLRRVIRRDAQDAYWPPIPRNEDQWRVSRAGHLEGLEALQQSRNVSLKPYLLGGLARRPSLDEEYLNTTGDVGGDVRWSITPNLTGILTINPDFAETEVDDQQVNITRFPLFFPEKREFFLESKGYFDFGFRFTAPGQPPGVIPFFSRRVGLTPRQFDTGTISAPIPIPAGVKLSGRAGRYNIGMLAAQTDDSADTPTVTYSVLRVSRDILSRSNWGLIGVHKEPHGPDEPADPNDITAGFHSNTTYGADMNFSVLKNFKFGGSLLQSRTPDAPFAEGSGHLYAQWSNLAWRVELQHRDIARSFNPEVGFVPRVGIEETGGYLSWSWRSTTAPIRRIEPHTRITYTADQDHHLATRRQHWAVSADMRDSSHAEVGYNPVFDKLDEPFILEEDSQGRPKVGVPIGSYDMTQWLAIWESDRGRPVAAEVFLEGGDFFDGRFLSSSLGLVARFSKHLRAAVELGRNDIDLPERAAGELGPGAPARGAEEFLTHLISTRLSYTATTRIFFDALVQYNTEVDDLTSNLRFNWKYRPGSDLYVVFNERRDLEDDPVAGTDRSFTVKWTYWLAL